MSWTSEFFTINGIKSSDIGVGSAMLIRTEAEINRQFIGNKNIIEEQIPFRDIPYFYRTEKSPIEFDLKFCLLDKEFTPDILFEMGMIFAKDRYINFSSCDFLGVEFFVITTSISLITYGSYTGWLQIHLRTSAPYGFALENIQTFDCTEATSLSPIIFEIFNKSNVQNAYGKYEYCPYLLIDMKGTDTSIELKNLSNSGYIFGFDGLTISESLEIDNEMKQIISNTNQPRLSKMKNNHAWFYLLYGRNLISCNASAIIQMKCRFPVYI